MTQVYRVFCLTSPFSGVTLGHTWSLKLSGTVVGRGMAVTFTVQMLFQGPIISIKALNGDILAPLYIVPTLRQTFLLFNFYDMIG